MSEEKAVSESYGEDAQSTANAAQNVKEITKKTSKAIKNAKQNQAAKAGAKAAANTSKVAGKAAGKAAATAAKAAGKAIGGALKALGELIVATFPWSLLVIGIILLLIIVIYEVTNSPIFNVLLKQFKEPTVNDIREYIQNTQNDESDWRFAYNKMLPEEQYDYIYNGNDATDSSEEVKGLADYILEAYIAARKSFEQDLGDIIEYHDAFFGPSSTNTATIDDVYKHAFNSSEGASDAWTTSEIEAYIQSHGIKVVGNHAAWYATNHLCLEDGVYVRKRISEYVANLVSGGSYDGGYFDYLVFVSDEEGSTDLPILKERLTLNLDLTYLANHDTLVGDLEAAADGKIVKESELTNVITYLIAGINVATCDISPSKGYLDFIRKTIGNPDVFDPSVKYQGSITLKGILGWLLRTSQNAEGNYDIYQYSLFTTSKIKFRTLSGRKKRVTMGILDTTACEVIKLSGTQYATGPYGEPVYQYYIKMKNPIDTDRLLWSMFVSDAAKTVTYKGIFDSVCQAYQGSYYDMYTIFEPLSADIAQNFYTRFLARYHHASATTLSSIAFARYADSEEIRKYLYGLTIEEVESNDEYFKDLWLHADESMNTYKEMLLTRYFVDKNGDGEITYEDYTGLLNETYYTYSMRPLYKCDFQILNTVESNKERHNLMHDGYGAVLETDGDQFNERCLYHKIFKTLNNSSCEACMRKNGGLEAPESDNGGINCADWASDWPAECPNCGKFAQRNGWAKIKVEYVRNPKPEFASLITISEEEYEEKIDVDIGESLAAIKGNDKVDLTTNYNRYNYGNNYDETFSYITSTGETDDALNKTIEITSPPETYFIDEDGNPKYYFSVYEFYGEYALGESWDKEQLEKGDEISNYFNGTMDMIEFNPDESKLKEFESLQEISEEYNRAQWNQWAENYGEAGNVANYRAVSILSALYKRKYMYHNLLNTDSLEAGLYDIDNGYERPIANDLYKVTADMDEAEKSAAEQQFIDDFNKEFSAEDDSEENTAFYSSNKYTAADGNQYNNLVGFEEDTAKIRPNSSSSGGFGDDEEDVNEDLE